MCISEPLSGELGSDLGERLDDRLESRLDDRLESRLDDRLDAPAGAPLAPRDSLLASRLGDSLRASVAARRDATAIPPEPRRSTSESPADAREDAGGRRPRADTDGSPVSKTREAGDRAASASGMAAIAGSGTEEGAAAAETTEQLRASGGGGNGAARRDQDHQHQQILLRLARPPPVAESGGSGLGRESFAIDVRQKPFQASRSLPILADQRPATGRDGKPVPNAGTSPAAASLAFGAAVDESQAFYDRLVGAARHIAADAVRENMRAGDKARDMLDRELADLAELLDANRITLDRARDFAIEKVDTLGKRMRRRINAAAASAFARLAAMRATYEQLMSAPRAERVRITGDLSAAIVDTYTKANEAHFALQRFGKTPTDHLTTADFPSDGAGGDIVAAAKLEAALQFIAPYVEADDRATAERLTAIEQALNPLNQCLPCQMDSAFQLLDMRMDHLSVAGPKAVTATRDGALQSVHDLVARLTLSIHDTHGTMTRQLVAQHDRTRRDLVVQARLEGEGEREDIRSMGTRQADALTAIAEGQSRGVAEAQARLSRQKGGDYAGMLLSGAGRLRANVDGMRRRYPTEQLAVGAAKSVARDRRRGTMERVRAGALAAFDRSMSRMVGATFDDLNGNTDKQFLEMADTPDRVRSSCEGFLGPAEEARNQEVAALTTQVASIGTRVTAAINGTNAAANEGENAAESNPEAMVCTPEPNMSVMPPNFSSASTTSTSVSTGSGSGSGTGEGSGNNRGQPMPPPASCGACPAANQAAPGNHTTTTTNTTSATTPGTGTGSGTTTTVAAPDASTGPGGNYISSVEFREYCAAVTRDPKEGSGTKAFIARANSTVQRQLETRADGAFNALDHWRAPDAPALMDALRGLTASSGAAVAEIYRMSHGSLVNRINSKFDDALSFTLSDPDTIEWNRNAALNALAGDVRGAAMNELRASFNWSNEDARIRRIMGSLTPAQMASLPPGELDALAKQLDGEDRARFDAMRRRHSGGTDRAVVLRDAIDRANNREGAERGRALQSAVGDAYNAPELAIEGPADREMADIFGLEHPDVTEGRRAKRWNETLTAFSGLENVSRTLRTIPDQPVSAMPGGATRPPAAGAGVSPAGGTPAAPGAAAVPPVPGSAEAVPVNPDRALEDALIRYATRDIVHPPPPRPRGGARADMDAFDTRPSRTDHLAPDMLNWFEQTVRHGPNSVEARGAQLLVEFNRPGAHESEKRLDTVLHIGSADAREGGGYRPRSTEEADRERDRILDQFERFRMGMAGEEFIGPIDVNRVRAAVRDRFANALPPDSPRQRLALGIIDSEHGNVDAAIDYAIATENTEMALRYLRRMDRQQVDALVARWNEAHPNGPSLYQRLGVFNHHWSIGNMNGAVFSGDEANELELALMAVPQNDRERGELALRTMNQQIEQSTRLGRLFAGSEYDRLKANRDNLLRLMGHRNGDFDSTGRLRATDPVTGMPMRLGNFDAQGNLIPARGSSYSAFERSIALSRITADNFTRAVDAAANFFTTLLVVAAAVITTALTGGAAASIWIPMLVTAAAGLAGVAMTAAIKGGRYSRDEVVRDLIMVAVQTVTAGIGSAGSIAARGGMPALRAVASRGISQGFKISEAALERFVVSKGGTLAATAGLGAELGIGAATGALSGGVTAALDPANRRSEDYGSRIWGGVFRGAAGGAASAGVARGVAGGLGRVGNRITGAVTAGSARSALLAGVLQEQALARALLTARRANWVASGITRAVAGGAAGSTSRVVELGLEGKASWDQILAEARVSFAQGMIQGALEHGVDPANRNPFRRGGGAMTAADMRRMPSWQRDEHAQLGMMAQVEVARAYAAAAAAGGTAPGTSAPRIGANDNAPPAAVRPPAGAGEVAARLPAPEEGFPQAGTRAPLADEAAPAGAFRPHEEGAEPRLKLRSIGGGDDSDRGEITQKIKLMRLPELLASTETRLGPISDTVDMTPEMLRGGRSIPEHSTFRATDPTDPAAARRNYDALLANDPHREVLLARNLTTGEYMVIQGGPHSVEPAPHGWVTERHSHPRLVSDVAAERLVRSMPSATGGDLVVLKGELDRIHGTVPAGTTVRRDSVIDTNINGVLGETHFSISRTGDDYSITVTFRPPQDGVSSMGPYRSIADYEAAALKLTGVDFSRPNDKTVRSVTAPRAAIGEGLTAQQRADADFVAARAGFAELPGPARRVVAPEDVPHAAGLRGVARSEAIERVRAMGLVDRPDSMIRLHNILNDSSIPPESRTLIARMVLEATREAMISGGRLADGDELMLFFHGAEADQFRGYREGGIDMNRRPGSHADDDVGPGLYMSQDFQSAERYIASGGAVTPFMVTRKQLGNVVDMRPGSLLRTHWESFFARNAPAFGDLAAANMLRGPGGFRLASGEPMPITAGGFGLFGMGKQRRGELVAAFLAEVARNPAFPDDVRRAAADPHLIMTDLGGPATYGNDRGFLTDQAAFRTQDIADLINRQMGFGRFAANDNDPAAPRMRSVMVGQADEAAEPALVTPRPEETLEVPGTPSARTSAADDDVEDVVAAATRRSGEATTDQFLDAMIQANAELHAPKPPASTYAEAMNAASYAQRRTWHDQAMAEFAARHPAEFGRLQALIGNDHFAIRNAISAANDQGREQQIVYLVNRMKVRGTSEADAVRIAREVIGLASDMHHRFALTLRHLVERQIWSGRIAALPSSVRGMAEGSSLLLYLGAHHAALLQDLHTRFLAQANLRPEMITPAFFEEFAARQLANHPVIQAATTGRRIVRFTSEADFNEAAATATPHTRYEFGRLAYTTDGQGRVAVAEGVPVRVKGHRGSSSLQTAIGNRGYATDVGFHLIAHIFGAVVNELTVVPGNGKRIPGDPEPNLNGSAYKVEFENIVRNILDTTTQIVEVQVVSVYDAGNTTSRPDHFVVRFRTDAGRWIVVPFVNKF